MREGGGLRRAFAGENPAGWALPLYRWRGILVEVSVWYVLFILLRVAGGLGSGWSGVGVMALTMLSLFVLVLLHEYGHCFACRRVGGDADRILMWPLGGLAFCRPPHGWWPDLITVVGGPAVNAVLLLPLGLGVWAATDAWQAAVFNPLNPNGAYAAIAGSGRADGAAFVPIYLLWTLHYMNAVLLGFNVLLPMYPLDGGRILRALLWRSMGHGKGTFLAARIGLGVAIGVAVLALVLPDASILLLTIALFAGVSCWRELQMLKMGAMGTGFDGGGYEADRFGIDAAPGPYSGSGGEIDAAAERKRAHDEKRERKRAEAAARENAEVDRILAKISESGMGSLTGKERRTLERAGRDGS